MGKLSSSQERTSKTKGGFTLVELSIVLVIIGLLIGGILAAQSMISTAKISAQVRQIGQFDAMVMNFKTKFNYLPGDAPAFGGDGDGILAATAVSGYHGDVSSFACETANFWLNANPDIYTGTPDDCAASTAIPTIRGSGRNVPETKMGKPGSFMVAEGISNGTDYHAETTNPANYYGMIGSNQLGGCSNHHYTTTTSSNAAAKPFELLALDRKMDDGMANSGFVLSGNITRVSCGESGGLYTSPLPTCGSGATYNVIETGYECTPLIRIGGSVGLPQ